jgi:hypothetical protein
METSQFRRTHGGTADQSPDSQAAQTTARKDEASMQALSGRAARKFTTRGEIVPG